MADYQIRVAGTLPCGALADFDHLTATPQPVQTVLFGMLDQAALNELLTRLELLGAHVIELRRLRGSCPVNGGR